MQINIIKQPGGMLIPASDFDAQKLTKFRTGEQYVVDIKLTRNPGFHRKVFAFFNFCFAHWSSDREFLSESKQFDVFRAHLTVLAGFYESHYNINGDVRIEAKSLSYSSMTQEEFEECYNALINAAIKHIFKTSDDNTLEQLRSFF